MTSSTRSRRPGELHSDEEEPGSRLDDRLLSAEEAAELLGMSAYWVREQARKRKIPFVALGPKVRKYRLSSLQSWLAEHEEQSR